MSKRIMDKEKKLDEQIFFEEHSRDVRFSICYFVPHHRNYTETSFFLAYWAEVVKSLEIFEFLVSLPFDVREIKASREDIARSRLLGITSLVALPVNIESMRGEDEDGTVIKVILSDDNVYESVKDFLSSKFGGGYLHISIAKSASGSERDYSSSRFEKYIKQRALDLYSKRKVPSEYVDAVREVLAPNKRKWKNIKFPGYLHGVTLANDVVARSLKLQFRVVEKLVPAKYQNYVPAVVNSCSSLWGIRSDLTKGVARENCICLYSEPVLWYVYKADVERDIFSGEDRSNRTVASLAAYIKSVKLSEKYIRESFGKDVKNIALIASDPVAQNFVYHHRRELELFNVSIGLMGAANLCPSLRFEPRINKIKGDLINIAACARGSGPHSNFKLNKMSHRLQRRMLSFVHPSYTSLLEKKIPEFSGVSLVSDLPLEWLPLRGLPLTLRCDVSRIPATPGNASLFQLLKNRYITISVAQFNEILIVRSFKSNDKIKSTLEDVLARWSGLHESYPKYRIVDVDTAEGFMQAVNDFKGALMIFDGHGALNTQSEVGSIIVGGKELDVWALQSRLRMPPIVLLSACDTIPIDGAHGATANAMLALGATTVLGTLLPVNALSSASFIARLLFRMSMLLPLVVNNVSYMPWRGFMSGMLRMTFCSELIDNLISEARVISKADGVELQIFANEVINSMEPDWYEQVLDKICERSEFSRAEVIGKCEFWGSLVDSLKYVQLGRPERINLRRKNVDEVMSVMLSEVY